MFPSISQMVRNQVTNPHASQSQWQHGSMPEMLYLATSNAEDMLGPTEDSIEYKTDEIPSSQPSGDTQTHAITIL